MKLIFRIFCTAAALWLSGVTTLQAQANLSVQGTIQNFDGSAVDNGSYDVIFKLYTTESGGTAVWSETQSVNVVGGVYSVLLGSANPLTAAFDQTYYLGITLPGGPELTPRSRLTSSPYALSLIGQDNKFPSTGPVGAGTASPTAGYQLHVKAATGDGKLLVEGVDNAKIDLKKGSNTTSITYDGTNVNIPNLNLSGFSYNPNNMYVTSKMAIGQNSVDANNALKVTGRTLLSGFLEVGGIASTTSVYGTGSFVGIYCYNALCGGTTTAFDASIRAQGSIYTGGNMYVNSDERIKKDVRTSDAFQNLALLRKMRVVDYRLKDSFRKGDAFTNGFIAQEVKQVYPEAVSMSSDFLPSVYELSSGISLKDHLLQVATVQKHGFVVGDEVKLMMPDDSERRVKVEKVGSETSFSVRWEEEIPERLFVFGKKVNDFHSVDYDRIFMLNVSATQELARRVEQLEAENALLRQYNEGLQKKTEALEQQNEGLRTDLNGLGERLLKLEKQGMNRLEK